MGRLAYCIGGGLLFAVGLYLGAGWVSPWLDARAADQQTTQARRTIAGPPGDVTALGRLEPVGGVIQVAGPPGEKVNRLLIAEGEVATRGQEICHLGGKLLYEAELARAVTALAELEALKTVVEKQADAALAEAELAVQFAGHPLDLEIQGQEAHIRFLESNVEAAQRERRRLSQIGRDIVSAQQVEQQERLLKQTEHEVLTAKIKLEGMKTTTVLKRTQAKAQIASAQAAKAKAVAMLNIDSAKRAVESAKARVEQGMIRSPKTGMVLKIIQQEGEALGGAPLLHLADLDALAVTAEVYESDVSRVAKGQKATITSHALPEPLKGTVEQVMWTVAGNNLNSLNPLAPVDLRVVEVRISLDPKQRKAHEALLHRLVNLQVDVQIHTTSSSARPPSSTPSTASTSP